MGASHHAKKAFLEAMSFRSAAFMSFVCLVAAHDAGAVSDYLEITAAQFNRVRNGETYEEVRQQFGAAPDEVDSYADVDDYIWHNGFDGAAIIVTFDHGNRVI